MTESEISSARERCRKAITDPLHEWHSGVTVFLDAWPMAGCQDAKVLAGNRTLHVRIRR